MTRGLSTLLSVLMAILPGASLATPATDVVEGLHQQLLGSMQSNEPEVSARAEIVREVVTNGFDFATIARVSLGKAWSGLKAEQQADFIKIFSELSVATYASRFAKFNGESFATLGEEAGRKAGEALVRTEIRRSSGKAPVSLQYLLRDAGGGKFRIVNVVADGVSDLSLKRTEYAEVIGKEGFPALRDRLLKKIAEMYGKPWQP
jgi:phospholipid transport system substrate-binding protein